MDFWCCFKWICISQTSWSGIHLISAMKIPSISNLIFHEMNAFRFRSWNLWSGNFKWNSHLAHSSGDSLLNLTQNMSTALSRLLTWWLEFLYLFTPTALKSETYSVAGEICFSIFLVPTHKLSTHPVQQVSCICFYCQRVIYLVEAR